MMAPKDEGLMDLGLDFEGNKSRRLLGAFAEAVALLETRQQRPDVRRSNAEARGQPDHDADRTLELSHRQRRSHRP